MVFLIKQMNLNAKISIFNKTPILTFCTFTPVPSIYASPVTTPTEPITLTGLNAIDATVMHAVFTIGSLFAF